MPFRANEVTVTATATLLFEAQAGDVEVTISGDTNDAVFIGGSSSVTTSTGMRVFGATGSERFTTRVRAGDELWAVTSSGSETLNYLARSI